MLLPFDELCYFNTAGPEKCPGAGGGLRAAGGRLMAAPLPRLLDPGRAKPYVSVQRPMKTRLSAFLIAAALLSFAAGSCARPPVGIRVSGTIEATEVRVSAKVGGELLELAVEEGSRVAKGQVLARIDHEALDLQLAQARAGVALAQAQLALLLKGARSEDIQQAQQALIQAEQNLRLAREDAERMKGLLASGSATQKQNDDAAARFVVAQAQYNAASQALRKLQNLARPEEVQAAQARVDQARAGVRLLEKSIADAEVSCPRDGLVTQRLMEPGELAAPGTTLLVLADLSRVELEVFVSEPDLGRVRLGQPVSVRIDGPPPNSFTGRISWISSAAEFTPKNIQTRQERVKLVYGVKIQIDNPQGILKAGMPADALLQP
jgi:HlyD family secretion protein